MVMQWWERITQYKVKVSILTVGENGLHLPLLEDYR